MQAGAGAGAGGAGEREMGVCEHTFQGIIRGQDVRATEKDRVKILESFRVGDVVRAVVVLFFPFLLLVWGEGRGS